MHLQPRPIALRAREPRSLREVDPQIQPLGLSVKVDAHNLPRVAQPQRCLEEKKILRLHPTAPIIDDQKPVRQSTARTLPTLTWRSPRGSVPTAETGGIEYRLRRSLADRLVLAVKLLLAGVVVERRGRLIGDVDSINQRPGVLGGSEDA